MLQTLRKFLLLMGNACPVLLSTRTQRTFSNRFCPNNENTSWQERLPLFKEITSIDKRCWHQSRFQSQHSVPRKTFQTCRVSTDKSEITSYRIVCEYWPPILVYYPTSCLDVSRDCSSFNFDSQHWWTRPAKCCAGTCQSALFLRMLDINHWQLFGFARNCVLS